MFYSCVIDTDAEKQNQQVLVGSDLQTALLYRHSSSREGPKGLLQDWESRHRAGLPSPWQATASVVLPILVIRHQHKCYLYRGINWKMSIAWKEHKSEGTGEGALMEPKQGCDERGLPPACGFCRWHSREGARRIKALTTPSSHLISWGVYQLIPSGHGQPPWTAEWRSLEGS